MHTDRKDVYRLTLLIQRMLDAEAICEAEGAALLNETEAACRSLEAGDAETARQHIEEVARFTEALIHSDRLDPADGRTVITTANGMLSRPADERD